MYLISLREKQSLVCSFSQMQPGAAKGRASGLLVGGAGVSLSSERARSRRAPLPHSSVRGRGPAMITGPEVWLGPALGFSTASVSEGIQRLPFHKHLCFQSCLEVQNPPPQLGKTLYQSGFTEKEKQQLNRNCASRTCTHIHPCTHM